MARSDPLKSEIANLAFDRILDAFNYEIGLTRQMPVTPTFLHDDGEYRWRIVYRDSNWMQVTVYTPTKGNRAFEIRVKEIL